MEQNQLKSENWGAGRKKKYAKTCFFNATEEVVAILDAIPSRQRADFINRCILNAAGRGELVGRVEELKKEGRVTFMLTRPPL